jgi:hypothetical protein
VLSAEIEEAIALLHLQMSYIVILAQFFQKQIQRFPAGEIRGVWFFDLVDLPATLHDVIEHEILVRSTGHTLAGTDFSEIALFRFDDLLLVISFLEDFGIMDCRRLSDLFVLLFYSQTG